MNKIIFAAIQAINHKIDELQEALAALEVIYFGAGELDKAAKRLEAGQAGKKEPPESTEPSRKRGAQGKPWSKQQRENYAATIAKRAKAGGMATAKKRPAAGPTWKDGERVTVGEAAAGERIPKPTTPPTTNGSLSMMGQKEAILQILEKTPRPLTAVEILDRLKVGGWHSRSENPRAALSVRLAEMRLSYETRAGLHHYQPIKPLELGRGEN